MADAPWMPEPTAAVFAHLSRCPAIERFAFVGGTALAWHLRHRLSEDLDFLQPTGTLEHRSLKRIVSHLESRFPVARMPFDRGTIDSTLNDGYDIEDLQQRFQVGGVKLEFFIADDRRLAERVKTVAPTPKRFGHIRVARLESLFAMKAQAMASRMHARDLFDIVTLCGRPEFGPVTLWETLEAIGESPDAAASKVAVARQRTDDPGLTALVASPPEFAVLAQRVTEIFSEARRQIAAR